MTEKRKSVFKSAQYDIKAAKELPSTPQTESPAYKLAFTDGDFMCRTELRPVRLQLELLKPQMIMDERGIESTVVLFGGARIPAPDEEPKGETEIAKKNLKKISRYYEEARKFAYLCSKTSLEKYGKEYVVVTGGGPGVMEAGNRGAHDAGAASIGLNIVLREEPIPNDYITPELCFNFHYFAIRKMHFLMRARAISVFPGGFGTMDELFETLTLIQTHRMDPIPIILFGEEWWRSIVNFELLAEMGTISPKDLDLFRFVDTAEQAWDIIKPAAE